jgi:putative endonuclease
MYYIYILKSRAKDWYYVGMTDNTTKRLLQHNSGKTKSTKPFRPFDMVYIENYDSKAECRKRELFIKNNHALKSALIEQIKHGAIV